MRFFAEWEKGGEKGKKREKKAAARERGPRKRREKGIASERIKRIVLFSGRIVSFLFRSFRIYLTSKEVKNHTKRKRKAAVFGIRPKKGCRKAPKRP